MTKNHNVNVPYNERAWVMTVERDQKVTIAYPDTWVDAVILPVGGMSYDAVKLDELADLL